MFKTKIRCFLAGLLAATLLISTLTLASGALREVFYGVNVVVNGELQHFDADSQPFISDGRTFLPVRGIAEALGVPVNWDGDTQTVYIGESPQISTNIGEIVRFGGIQWRVLDVQDGKALLLSEYLLEERPYNRLHARVTWATSDMRLWLNYDFYNYQFAPAQRVRIAETNIVNNDNSKLETHGGNDTIDKIFLLSIEEVVYYFGDSGMLQDETVWWWLDDQYDEARIAYFETGTSGDWWLRSPGATTDRTSNVGFDGRVSLGGTVTYADLAVRPALWIYL